MATDQLVECPRCGFEVYEHALELSCFGHIPGDDLEARQKVQERERAEEYSEEVEGDGKRT